MNYALPSFFSHCYENKTSSNVSEKNLLVLICSSDANHPDKMYEGENRAKSKSVIPKTTISGFL